MSDSFVIDASILIQAYVQETGTLRVQMLLAGLENEEPDQLHLPEFCLLECANILWKHIRFHKMPVSRAQQAVMQFRSLPFVIHPVFALLPRALAIGLEHQMAVYDALYIALAESLGYPLVTADQRQSQVAEAVGVMLKLLEDFSEFADN